MEFKARSAGKTNEKGWGLRALGFKGIARKSKIIRPLTFGSRGKLNIPPLFQQTEMVYIREMDCP